MLSHLRVVDLTDGGASIAGRILRDLGAEVILIEPPGGLSSRTLGPFVDDITDPERSLEFWARHTGKRSFVVDLNDPSDRLALLDLAKSADAWIDDRSFPALGKHAFDIQSLSKAAPRLVQATVTAFGTIGPKSNWSATDLVATAASGALWLTGDADRPPVTCSIPQAFYHAGAEAAASILIALHERKQSGLGQHLDVSAQTAMMAATQSGVLAFGWNSKPSSRSGGGLSLGDYRLRFIYECADGFVNFTFLFGEPIGHATARFFAWMDEEGFSNEALRSEDWVGYGAKFLGGQLEVDAHEAVMEAIERFTRTKTKADLLSAAFERRLLIVPLADMKDLVESEQLTAREYWRLGKHSGLDREILHPGPFAKLSATPLDVSTHPPTLGEFPAKDVARPGKACDATKRAPKHQPLRESASAALDGLKVLDFTWVYAGPAVTRQLADFGADVIKIESNRAHDALRANQPYKDGIPGPNRSANFSNVNLGKRSLGLNLGTAQGIEVALSLVDWADVVVENFSPKAMKAWGLDWEVLRRRKPELVMLSSSLSGSTGPHAMLAGYGTMGSAIAGFGFITGWPDRRPSAPYVAYTDYVAPRFATAALLAALDHKERTGDGQHIDLSQTEASMHFLGSALLDYTANGRIAAARGNSHPHFSHTPSGVFPTLTADRWIALAAPTDDAFRSLSRLAEKGWAGEVAYASARDRRTSETELNADIAAWTKTWNVEDLEEKLQAAGVPAHRVSTSQDLFSDPQLASRGHFIPIEYADLGPLPYENSRTRFSRTPAKPRPCPNLGEHNSEILEGVLGLSEDEMTELVIAGAVE